LRRSTTRETWRQCTIFTPPITYCTAPSPTRSYAAAKASNKFVNASREAFHEVDITVEDQIVEGDKVVTRWKARIVPQSGVAGVHLTDYPVTGTGILIDRISGSKIQETWAEERLHGIQGTAEMVTGN
jgi:predicted ester cyclase